MSKDDMPPERIATAGRCTCGAKVVRGIDDHAQLVTVDIYDTDAASELLAHTAGRASYTLGIAKRGGIYLTRRTTRDIARHPVGYRPQRVVLAHICTPTKGNA